MWEWIILPALTLIVMLSIVTATPNASWPLRGSLATRLLGGGRVQGLTGRRTPARELVSEF